MKSLYLVEDERQQIYVVAENLTQVINHFPESRRVEKVCDTEDAAFGPRLVIL